MMCLLQSVVSGVFVSRDLLTAADLSNIHLLKMIRSWVPEEKSQVFKSFFLL